MTSPLRVALRNRLKAAMRAGDRQTAGAMRNVLAALENAEAVPTTSPGSPVATSEHIAGGATGLGAGDAARRSLSPEDERAVVDSEVSELRSSSEALAAAGQHERSAELVRLAETIEHTLEA